MGCNSLSQNDCNVNLKFLKKNKNNQMKKTSLLILGLILSAITFAQAPNKMSFQTVVRNSQGKLVLNKSIGVRISILQSTSTGTAVYVETHTQSSNANGLLTLEVGMGIVSSGSFAAIDWSQGPYFLKTEMDVNGSTNYSISGVTEFVSVPYAMNSKTSDAVKTVANGANVGDMNYWNGTTWIPLNKGNQGQTLTFCDGKPAWTIGGVCPGTINALNCSSATSNGTLTATTAASGVTSVISYSGGNGGPHNGQIVNSTGVTGLTAALSAGTFAIGNGSLTYVISGTPSSGGTAIFSLSIGGSICTLTRVVANPTSGYGSNITDVDGNTYKTVYIGTQQWMGENLKVSKYSDGTTIPNITDNTQWQNNSTGAWSYYNNDAANNAKYGKLYNWYAVSKTTNGNKNICPTGWHVPNDAEWTVLTDYLGGASVAGGKLKEVGTTNWDSPNTDATNVSLFTGLPGGDRYYNGNYVNVGGFGYWWSSTEDFTGDAWTRHLVNNYEGVGRFRYGKRAGFSVRCLRD
jgi:uncharacterized protein (TIGR02145 family)